MQRIIISTGILLLSVFTSISHGQGISIYDDLLNDRKLTIGITAKSTSALGDVNNDGADDLLIQTLYPFSELVNGNLKLEVLLGVIYGSTDPSTITQNMADLDGSNGFRISLYGEIESDGIIGAGGIVASTTAGDLNADGKRDIVILYRNCYPRNKLIYRMIVLDGEALSSAGAEIDVRNLPIEQGYELSHEVALEPSDYCLLSIADRMNISITKANMDDAADLVITGVRNQNPVILFGGPSLSNTTDFTDVNGENGYKIVDESDRNIYEVWDAGDLDADGINELVVNVGLENRFTKSRAIVIYGRDTYPNTVDVSNSNDPNTVAQLAGLGRGIGDVNGDGIDDLTVDLRNSSMSALVFGSTERLPTTLKWSNELFESGRAVLLRAQPLRSIGDINADGINDLMGGFANLKVWYGRSDWVNSSWTPSAALQKTGGKTFGEMYASAGDINGDDVDDLVIIESQLRNTDPNVDFYDPFLPGETNVIFGSTISPFKPSPIKPFETLRFESGVGARELELIARQPNQHTISLLTNIVNCRARRLERKAQGRTRLYARTCWQWAADQDSRRNRTWAKKKYRKFLSVLGN